MHMYTNGHSVNLSGNSCVTVNQGQVAVGFKFLCVQESVGKGIKDVNAWAQECVFLVLIFSDFQAGGPWAKP